MPVISPQEMEAKVEARFRIFLILWFAILSSVGFLLVLAVAIGTNGEPNPPLSYALLGAGMTMVVLSLLIKQRMVRQAIDKSNLASLQSAHIVSLALCESSALFGLLDRLVTGSQAGWFAFAIAAIGIFLHFPKKDHLRAVSQRSGLNV